MKDNLRTVFFDSDGKLNSILGWHISLGKDTFSLPILGETPVKGADLSASGEYCPWFVKSGSIKRIDEEYSIPIYSEEHECYTGGYEAVKIKRPIFDVIPDDNFYYLFILGPKDPHAFSADLKILTGGSIENDFHSEEYIFFAYTSLPNDVPFILDTRSRICISPFCH